MEPILALNEVTKRFPSAGGTGLTPVDHVSFSLYPGEVLGLVGESGCGKSTLARVITRLTDATSGSIFLCGQDITNARGKELRRVYRAIQMVFQAPAGSFDPRRTIGAGIGEPLANLGYSKSEQDRRVLALLEQCGLSEEYAGRYPHELSGGQCQRAAIARALAVGPKVLVCDEATSALDVTVQKQIMELLGRLKAENQLSCLFICHNLALVQSFCDRVLVMEAGNIVESGTPDQVIFSPQTACTKRLVEAAL